MRALYRLLEKHPELGPVSLVANLLFFTVLIGASLWQGVHAWRMQTPGIQAASIIAPRPDHSVIVLDFSTPMPGLRVVAGARPPFQVKPPLAYSIRWENRRRVYLVPRGRLVSGLRLTIEPRAGLQDLEGHLLESTAVTVSTPPLRVVDVGIPIRTGDRKTRCQLQFSGSPRPKELKQHIRVTPVGQGRISALRVSSAKNVVMLQLDHTPDLTRIRITVRPGLIAKGGTLPGWDRWERVLPVPSDLTISKVMARTRGSNATLEIQWRINGTVDCADALRFIHLYPSVKSLVLTPRWLEGDYMLEGDFEPRTRYTVRFSPGLRTTGGRTLTEPVARTLITPRLGTTAVFASSGLYLPRGGKDVIAIRTTGIARFELSAYRIHERNLVRLIQENPYRESVISHLGPRVLRRELPVPNGDGAAKAARTFALSIAEVMAGLPPGVYMLQVCTPGDRYLYWWDRDQHARIVVWTQLAVSVLRGRNDKLAVWTTGFGNGRPVPGCTVEMLSDKNRVLGRGHTGKNGVAEIASGIGGETAPELPGADSEERPVLVVVRKGNDLSLLPLNSEFARHALQSGTSGDREYPSAPYTAFLYAERDICRPGESLHFSMLVRSRDLTPAGGFPVTLSIATPEGKTFLSRRLAVRPEGFATTSVNVPAHAKTGRYTAVVRPAGKGDSAVFGRFSFLVLAYTPENIRLTSVTDKERYHSCDNPLVSVEGRYFFGRPAANCPLEVSYGCRLRLFSPPGFGSYTFCYTPEDKAPPPVSRLGGFSTGTDGRTEVTVPLSKQVLPPVPLTLTVSATLHQPGGRTVSRSLTCPVDPTPVYLGLRREAPDPAVARDGSQRFSWVCVSPDGHPDHPPTALRYDLYRIVWRSALRLNSNREYIRDWTEEFVAIAKGTVPVDDKATSGNFRMTCPGDRLWELRVRTSKSETRLRFTTGAPPNPVRSSAGAAPVVTLDRPLYEPGATARLCFTAPASGNMLLCLATDRVLTTRVVAIKSGPNTVSVPVPETPFGCIYASLYLQTHLDTPNTDRLAPNARFGLVRLPISHTDKRLDVTLTAPAVSRPGTRIKIGIQLKNGGRPKPGHVELFAVDAGILTLTDYTTPDPFSFFFGPRECGVTAYDGAAHLYPDLSGLPSTARVSTIGGDRSIELLRGTTPQNALAPAILYLGVLDIPESGNAFEDVPLPDFTGALRFMAVAFAGDRVGSGERLVRVRDPVTIQVTAPRTVAGGDEFEVSVHAVNNDLPATQCRLTLEVDSALAHIAGEDFRKLPLEKHGEKLCSYRLIAVEAGSGPIPLLVRCTSNAAPTTKRAVVTLRPAALPIAYSGVTAVSPGSTTCIRQPKQLRTDTLSFSADVSCGTRAVVMPALAWLDNYPYGCLEQTTSTALPFLFFRAIDSKTGGDGDPGTRPPLFEAKVRKAVRRISGMQLTSGAFSMWPGSDTEWTGGSIYAAHFLLLCREAGNAPAPGVWSGITNYLKHAVSDSQTLDSPRYIGYAHFLLARAGQGQPDRAEGFLALQGTKDRAGAILAASALILAGRAHQGREWLDKVLARAAWGNGDDYGLNTPVSGIALAAIALESAIPESALIPNLISRLQKQQTDQKRWRTTFDNALATTAILKWQLLNPTDAETHGTTVDSATEFIVDMDHPFHRRWPRGSFKELTISNQGPGRLFAAWFALGVPATPLTVPLSHGIDVQRDYLSSAGKSQRTYRKGDMVVVRITLPGEHTYRDLVITDLLPGGLEIENRTLLSGSMAGASFTRTKAKCVEALDDRVLFFGDLSPRGNTIRYTCRAVSRGVFTAPAVAVHAMYDPDVWACTPGGPPVVIR